QHRHTQINVIVDTHYTLAVVQPVKSSNVLRNRTAPRHRQREKERIQPRIVEALADVFANCENNTLFRKRYAGETLDNCLPLLRAHAATQRHDVSNLTRQNAFKPIKMLVSFRKDDRRLPLTNRFNNFLTDGYVPTLILNQLLVES